MPTIVGGLRGRARISIAALLAAAAVGAGATASSAEVINVPWTELLPPLPTASNPQPGPVPNCRVAKPKCVRVTIQRLRRLRNDLGCDHRAVFATTYLELTRQILDDMRAGLVRRHMIDPKYLYTEDGVFANFYFRVVRAWERGDPIPEAWRIAFETAESDDKAAVQDMLLGINAHVQNDMPFVLASLGPAHRGRALPKARPRLHQRHRSTAVYPRVVAAVRQRFDPSMDLSNSPLIPLDDLAGLELTRTWREVVWRNAERLMNADGRAERTRVAQSIEDYAATERAPDRGWRVAGLRRDARRVLRGRPERAVGRWVGRPRGGLSCGAGVLRSRSAAMSGRSGTGVNALLAAGRQEVHPRPLDHIEWRIHPPIAR